MSCSARSPTRRSGRRACSRAASRASRTRPTLLSAGLVERVRDRLGQAHRAAARLPHAALQSRRADSAPEGVAHAPTVARARTSGSPRGRGSRHRRCCRPRRQPRTPRRFRARRSGADRPRPVQDELGHPAGGRVADPNAHLPAGVLDVVGLGVRDDDAAMVVERDAARPAELRPARQPFAVLVEQLDAVVRAIRDE